MTILALKSNTMITTPFATSTLSSPATGKVCLLVLLWLASTAFASTPCTPCLDGSTPPDLDKLVMPHEESGMGDLTCGFFANLTDNLSQGETVPGLGLSCEDIQIGGFAFCDCPRPENLPCTLCADGNITMGDAYEFHSQVVSTVMGDDFLLVSDTIEADATCRSLAVAAPVTIDKYQCYDIQLAGAAACGCATEPETLAVGTEDGPSDEPSSDEDTVYCTLCPDGAAHDPAKNLVVAGTDDKSGESYSCLHLAIFAFLIPMDQCPYIQIMGVTNCGCPSGDSYDSLCTLCKGESYPGGSFDDVVVGTDEDGDEITCAHLNFFSSFVPHDECTSVQLIGAASCGCSSSPEVSCHLCPGGNFPDNDSLDQNAGVDEDTGEEYSCRDYMSFLAQIPESSCDAFKLLMGNPDCGCPEPSDSSTPSSLPSITISALAAWVFLA